MLKWIFIAFLVGVILWCIVFKTNVAVKSFRVVCDLRDQNAFNLIVDNLAAQPYLLEANYTETTDTIIIDIYCLFFVYKKLKHKFKTIPNTEVI